MMNIVVLMGRLANDPEMRYTASGTAVTNFRIAVDRPRRRSEAGQEGERETDFLSIVTFGSTAENCAKYLDKGSLVGIEGRVQSRNWETQDGQKRSSVEIVANNVQFLESRQEAERRRSQRAERGAGPGPTPDSPPDVPEGEDFFGD
jgi:single-strand DNA-binding protein